MTVVYSVIKTDSKLALTGDVKQDAKLIGKCFGQNGYTYDLPDKAIQAMIGPLQNLYGGLTTVSSIEKYMEEKKQRSNLEKFIRAEESKENGFSLENGDGIKGVSDALNSRVFKSFLSNGAIAGDFLELNSSQDLTPYDSDISIILGKNKNEGNEELIDKTETRDNRYSKNGFLLVIKNVKDKSEITRKSDDIPVENEENVEYNYLKSFSKEADLEKKKGEIIKARNRRANGKFSRKYEVFHDNEGSFEPERMKTHYGIRTAIGSEDIDAILIKNEDNNYENLEVLERNMAMSGIYIPIYTIDGNLLFDPDRYLKYREEMRGMKFYEADDFKVNLNGYNERVKEKIEELFPDGDVNNAVNKQKADKERKVIFDKISKGMSKIGLKTYDKITGNLRSGFVELIDTGSTGRGTNILGDSDFDFMLKIDKDIMEDSKKYDKFEKIISDEFPIRGKESKNVPDGIRYKNVELTDSNNQKYDLDIDISYAKKTEKVDYSTDMSIKERLDNIKQTDPEGYKITIANIILAKEMLKKANIYKKNTSSGHSIYGGFGGAGVENWILQNGGSFYEAISTFIQEANKCRNHYGEIDTDKFREEYPIYDYGENHKIEETTKIDEKGNIRKLELEPKHDHFINGFSDEGLRKAPEILEEIKKELTPIKYNSYAPSKILKQGVIATKDVRQGEIEDAEKNIEDIIRNEKKEKNIEARNQ